MPVLRSHTLLSLCSLALGVALCAAVPVAHAQRRTRVVYVVPASAPPVARARLGVQLDIGGFARTDAGLGFGLTGAFGTQYGDHFAIYYQPRLILGGFESGPRDGAVFAWYNTAMFELTVLDLLQLGAGPSLDLGLVNLCDSNMCDGFGGAFFGADFRAAIVVGGRARGPRYQRSGVDFALHIHPTWTGPDRGITTATIGVGFELY